MKKIFKCIFLAIFLASCSSLHHDRVVEVDRKQYIKTDKRLDRYSNEDILANNDLVIWFLIEMIEKLTKRFKRCMGIYSIKFRFS